ncbi:hypothetical protein QTP88_028206 [Uroleucon formosanum]
MSIESAAKCEIRAVIRYLIAKEKSPHEIFNEVRTVYDESHMNRISVYKWCREFKNDRMNVHDDLRSGRPSILTDDILQKVEKAVRDDRRLTLDELSAMFPQLSKSLLHETITESLGFHNLCARWVPKQLTEQHMLNRVQASREFLERYELDGDNFLKSIVTGDETWVAHYTPETKRQSEQRRHTTSPSTKKFKTTISAKKIMASVFWDHKGIILIKYLPQGRPSTQQVSDHMSGKKFSTDEELKGAVDKWSKEVAAEFYEAGIKNLSAVSQPALKEMVTM